MFEKIISSTFNYGSNIQIGRKPIIDEIAIDKSSELGEYIIYSEEKNRKYITLKEIINALLASVEKEELEYYNKLTEIVKKFKEKNCSELDYISF